ncbi:L-lysine exporter family protein LysE/ArgO [Skermanella aerolata]|jgi:L-lysine exporter family protein LysE/ArgO|uniref:Amino acid transporter n=1 Tax=Skermanella aerolata TaxID=393310 RepID=A0A512DTW3_9PROT|nr:LysE/ArgO family amino acid transporter [Skermanella aerolata]KJB92025.1 amino acid transporter [Skermanella aerolata KACC 11604]GEO39913.1 amino acid transporter [Skermanella aerolata]
MLSAFFPGLLLGLSLIVAIGAQNAFVLRQGLRGEHVLAVCLTCAVSDAVLILVGVGGFAQASNWVPWLETATRYAGAAFLLVYGLRSFWAAARSGGALAPADTVPVSLGATLATCLALTWLNPHVYLDTVVLLGSVSTQFAANKGLFAAGAMTASFVFFFSLGYGARLLRPVFARPGAWRVLELGIGIVMCTISVALVA